MYKICTSEEQSKKLIELGIDVNTADMAYWKRSYRPNDYAIMVHYTKELQEGFEAKGIEYIPAWSLTALLSVLPSASLDNSDDHHFRLHCMEKFTEWHDNPIDACVAMIEKLNELNLL